MKDFFLLDSSLSKKAYPFLALGAMVFIGFLMLTHGIPKIFSFNLLSATFPDPIGLGSYLSLVLAILAEVGCSLLLILGVMTRLAVLPLIFNMAVAVTVVHGSDVFAVKELAVMYLGFYVLVLFLGGGKYSFDRVIFSRYFSGVV